MNKRQNFDVGTVGITIWKSVGGEKSNLNVLYPIDFHLVILTVVEEGLTLCCVSTVTTVPITNDTLKKYHRDSRVHGNATNHLLVTVNLTIRKTSRDKEFERTFFFKYLAQIFCLEKAFIW